MLESTASFLLVLLLCLTAGVLPLLCLLFHHLISRRHRSPLPSSVIGRRMGLVIAHPDDECMFFGPTLLRLREAPGTEVFLLCLSSGDAFGVGKTRQRELLDSCEHFGIPVSRIHVVDDPELQDGLATHWEETAIRPHLERFVQDHRLDTLLTFDAYGVSGHPNHSSCYRAVLAEGIRSHPLGKHLRSYALVSEGILRKYSSVFGALWGFLFEAKKWEQGMEGSCWMAFADLSEARIIREALYEHRSQLVWYRKLFIVLSQYAYMNKFRPISAEEDWN